MTDGVNTIPITLDDMIAVDGIDAYRGMEIVDGEWVAKTKDEAMSIGHGRLGACLIHGLYSHVHEHDLGEVYMSETIFILNIDSEGVRLMRKPDVSFVLKARVKPPESGCYHQAPDLAVEIVSPSERIGVVRKKLRDYFAHGTKQVWLIYDDDKEIVVHQTGENPIIYAVNDILTGGDLLPGFELPLAELFAD